MVSKSTLTALSLAILCFASIGICAQELDVSGVFIDDKGGAAIINGTSVGIGDTVAGAKIVKVTKEGVVFQRDGQLFFQPLRDMTSYLATQKAKPVAVPKPAPAKPSTSSSASTMPMSGLLVNPVAVKQTLQKIDELKATSAERGKMADQFMDDMKSGK